MRRGPALPRPGLTRRLATPRRDSAAAPPEQELGGGPSSGEQAFLLLAALSKVDRVEFAFRIYGDPAGGAEGGLLKWAGAEDLLQEAARGLAPDGGELDPGVREGFVRSLLGGLKDFVRRESEEAGRPPPSPGGSQEAIHYCIPGVTLQQFRVWSREMLAVVTGIADLLDPLDPGLSHSGPELLHADGPGASLLQPLHAWLLVAHLKLDCQESWQEVYNSKKHGKAWPSFAAKVSGRGPTLVLIKDTAGHLFGGYAPDSWEKQKNSFYGDEGYSSFVFRLHPVTSIHKPTGLNTNFQYFASGCTSGINPNGAAFGGQINAFALFVDAAFEVGHSFAGPTYKNPVLASGLRYEVDTIECWALDKRLRRGSRSNGTKNVLMNDEFNAERMIMGMVGMRDGEQGRALASPNLVRREEEDAGT